MQKYQSFHPALILSSHFDDLISQIDIKTEAILSEQNLTEEVKKALNNVREKQISKIEEIKSLNLNDKFDENKYLQKWQDLISNKSLNFDNKVDKIKGELIVNDCLLMTDLSLMSTLSLWITPWFLDKTSLEFLRLIYFCI